MRYLSVCSGIEAASVAWEPLGFVPVAFSEVAPFPAAVLSHRFPHVPNVGDMTNFEEWNLGPVDLLVGGTPCQSFSVAGLRGGLEDDRGNLALTYCRILQRFKPRWFVWENVPGVLSSNGGRDFGSILGAMAQLGYGVGYRILDAQFFGVPQRRRRVFVVGCAGDWRRAAEVLFEPGCLCGDFAKGRKARKDVASPIGGSSQSGGFRTTDLDNSGAFIVASTGSVSHCLNAGGMGRIDYETETMISYNFFPSAGQGSSLQAVQSDISPALNVRGADNDRGIRIVNPTTGVRRLTPRECERLQGFPDDWTLIPHRGKPAADGPRYKAIGNSMAVPVMRWIGKRMLALERLETA